MRRSLVLTDESARHWFRARLPQQVSIGREATHEKRERTPATSDLRRFFNTYCASLVVVTILIA